MAFEPTFRGGVFVALGDVDGDGFVDLVVGAGDGRPAEVKVFSGRDGVVEKDLIAFDNFTGGVHVAVGDVNGDGHADIIAGMGFGGAQVKVFNGKDLSVLRTVNAFPNFDGGVWVASGDVNGDGFADLVLGAGQGGGPHVRVLNGRTGADLFGFFAFAPTFTGGVHVAASDVTGDGHADIITGAGPGGSPEVRVFDGVSGNELSAFLAYAPSFTGGVFVAAAPPANKLEIETPVNGESVPGSFPLTGWAFEEGPSSTGVANVQVWAFPVDGTPATFLGVAAMGDARPAVATTYGAQYANSGFHLNVSGLASGTYDVVVYAFSPLTQTFNMQGIVRITVAP
jgi:hypothetical protein